MTNYGPNSRAGIKVNVLNCARFTIVENRIAIEYNIYKIMHGHLLRWFMVRIYV